MMFKSEDQLYNIVNKIIEEHKELLKDYHTYLNNVTEGELRYIERQVNGKKLYLLGETHHSRKPVDYVHNNIIPKIKQNPQNWLLLREDAEDIITDAFKCPTQFYFQELAKFFAIPYKEALADLYSSDTRTYICEKENISEENIDELIIAESLKLDPEETSFIFKMVNNVKKYGTLPDEQGELKFKEWIDNLSKYLKKSQEYTLKILSKPPIDLDFEVVTKPWNDYSRQRFNKILKQYSDKSCILVSVGYGHLLVFE